MGTHKVGNPKNNAQHKKLHYLRKIGITRAYRYFTCENMALELEPDIGVPYERSTPYLDLRERAQAACNTALELEKHGLDIRATERDQEQAAGLLAQYAEDPDAASKKVSHRSAAELTPASLVYANTILDEYGRAVVTDSMQIRQLVTNKLLIETEHSDAKVRLKALELLGKISDVGLFSEKSHVTVEHQSPDELRNRLRRKLQKLVSPTDVEDGVVTEVDRELGLDNPKPIVLDASPTYDD